MILGSGVSPVINVVVFALLTVRLNDASVVVPQLSVIRIMIVCVPTGAAFEIVTTPVVLWTDTVPVYEPAFCTAIDATLPLSLGPVAGLTVVPAPKTIAAGVL